MARFKRAPRRYTKKYSKKRVFRKRFGKKTFRRGRKAVGRKAQTACAHCTLELSDVTNQTIGNRSVSLSQFDRLMQIAPLYRYYRITKVEYKYESFFNVAQQAASAVPGATLPSMYWVMDRQGVFPYDSLTQLQDLGQKPFKFTRDRTISYAPSVASTVAYNAGGTPATVSRAIKAPWFPTATQGSPSDGTWASFQHYGHTDVFDDEGVAGSAQICRLSVTCYVEFKEPALQVM